MRKKNMLYFKQDKMFDMEKSFSLHSVIVPTNHAVTFEYFINEGGTTRKPVILLCAIQGSRLTFQLTSLVASDSLNSIAKIYFH